MKKRVLLVGGRSKAKSLAISLLKKGYAVTVINENREDCLQLASIKGLQVICGDGTKAYILDEANVKDCCMVIALSNQDADNLVVCELCKKRFGVPKAISIVSDPMKIDFFHSMGVDHVVCAVSMISHTIEHIAIMDEMYNVVSIEGNVEIIKVYIQDYFYAVGKCLWELALPSEVIVGCILRNDTSIVPSGDTKIMVGDMLVVICKISQQEEAIETLVKRR